MKENFTGVATLAGNPRPLPWKPLRRMNLELPLKTFIKFEPGKTSLKELQKKLDLTNSFENNLFKIILKEVSNCKKRKKSLVENPQLLCLSNKQTGNKIQLSLILQK
jgi:hypothetical protein